MRGLVLRVIEDILWPHQAKVSLLNKVAMGETVCAT